MSTFGGERIFGTAISMSTTEGTARRVTVATGLLYGKTLAELESQEERFRTLMESGVRSLLIDPIGASWPAARLESFTLQGRIRQSPAGLLFRSYKAKFFHVKGVSL